MKKTTSLLCIVFAVVMILALPISASTPYHTYTYSISGTALRSPDAYIPDREINTDYMGITDVSRLAEIYPDLSSDELAKKANPKTISFVDLEVDADNNVYIVDKDNARVIVLDAYYKVKFIIDSFKNLSGNIDSLKAPEGVFITETKVVNGVERQGRIFVCDTGNARILTFDLNGNFLSEIGRPQSELLSSTTDYRPVALAVDRYDRLYVVDRGVSGTNGIIVMTDSGEFTGYIGAQKANISFWDKIWRNFQTEEQKELSASYIPATFNNIALAGDFIYVTIDPNDENAVAADIIAKSKSGDNAPVKMLNAAGSELMRRNGFYPPSGEIDFVGAISAEGSVISGPSKVTDVAVGPENTWSIIDEKRSKVFTYDFDGNLLFAFGDTGDLLGSISKGKLESVVYQEDVMLLLDAKKNSFTVYQRTEYGDVLIRAIENQNNRRYDVAIEDWTEVLKRNSNFDAAYIGIGNALYRTHEYKAAIEQYKSAYDTENYSTAYSEIRQQWISDWLFIIPIIIFVLCFALSKFFKFAKKVNKRAEISTKKRTYVEELLFAFHLMLHPFDGFWDLKHEKRGSVRAGTTILAVTVLAFYYQSVGAGYVSNPQKDYMSLFGTITSVVAPLALWVIGNWCLTTLFDGEGSFKDIYIASTYSLTPMILMIIPTTIASNFVLESELKMISFIVTLGFIWLGMLIFVGTMVTHDYTIGKNVITIAGTLLAMIFIMFLAILFTTLLGKLVGFVTNIVTELKYRI